VSQLIARNHIHNQLTNPTHLTACKFRRSVHLAPVQFVSCFSINYCLERPILSNPTDPCQSTGFGHKLLMAFKAEYCVMTETGRLIWQTWQKYKFNILRTFNITLLYIAFNSRRVLIYGIFIFQIK